MRKYKLVVDTCNLQGFWATDVKKFFTYRQALRYYFYKKNMCYKKFNTCFIDGYEIILFERIDGDIIVKHAFTQPRSSVEIMKKLHKRIRDEV